MCIMAFIRNVVSSQDRNCECRCGVRKNYAAGPVGNHEGLSDRFERNPTRQPPADDHFEREMREGGRPQFIDEM